ncbi:MAG: T9SS type A sorting domain-containing protein [Crocinitomicaceae bacterium]|nr:T9SS type A sorting domain-containing protein [Crocinitomicaceae bacterium]
MKKSILFIVITICNIAAWGQASVANNSFENWYDLGVKDSLDYWSTSTQQYQSNGWLDVNNSYEIPNAYSGSKAIHLETVLHFDAGSGQNDTLFGFVVKQSADGNGFTGFPYADTVNIFKCWYKCGIVTGDQAVVIIELSNSGTVFSSTTFPVTGNVGTWTLLSVPLSTVTDVPDSVFIGVASSDPFNPGIAKPGSWIELDEFSFEFASGTVVPSAIPNNSFENWTYETIEQPTAWFSFDQMLYPQTQSAYVTKSSTASVGSYSMQIETTFENLFIGIPSIATNGYFEPALDSVVGGTPFIAQPAQFTGMYQFSPSLTDTAWVYIDFWNATSGLHTMYIDTLLDASSWTPWSIDLTFTEAPDSVLIYFWGGQNLGSTLLVDDIQFTGGDVSVNESSISDFTLYPNPANNEVTILFEKADVIRIFNTAGVLVDSFNVNESNLKSISTINYENGIYLIQLIDKGKVSVQKLVVEH